MHYSAGRDTFRTSQRNSCPDEYLIRGTIQAFIMHFMTQTTSPFWRQMCTQKVYKVFFFTRKEPLAAHMISQPVSCVHMRNHLQNSKLKPIYVTFQCTIPKPSNKNSIQFQLIHSSSCDSTISRVFIIVFLPIIYLLHWYFSPILTKNKKLAEIPTTPGRLPIFGHILESFKMVILENHSLFTFLDVNSISFKKDLKSLLSNDNDNTCQIRLFCTCSRFSHVKTSSLSFTRYP